jgi:diaminopimelate epimerase
MSIPFVKYQSLGNDFIIVEVDSQDFFFEPARIKMLCLRHFGIGADGLITFHRLDDQNVFMRFFNCDGGEVDLCGNGLRSLFHHTGAKWIKTRAGCFQGSSDKNAVSILMPIPRLVKSGSVFIFSKELNYTLVHSGVEHVLINEKNLQDVKVDALGKKIRFHEAFTPQGANVNFYHLNENEIHLRTYERGVEKETQACGTGALAAFFYSGLDQATVYPTSQLPIFFKRQPSGIEMVAEVKKVFEGKF